MFTFNINLIVNQLIFFFQTKINQSGAKSYEIGISNIRRPSTKNLLKPRKKIVPKDNIIIDHNLSKIFIHK